MKKQIIESNTEPNKNCLWLTPNGLKRYGKSGWEDLTNGSGGKEDKVFEIKVRRIPDGTGATYKELMINGAGWFRADRVGDAGNEIGYLNDEVWENKDETIREIFKDIESYNKLKVTELMQLDENTEIPLISTEDLTYQLIEIDDMFGIFIYSKVYTNKNLKYCLSAAIAPNGESYMAYTWQ